MPVLDRLRELVKLAGLVRSVGFPWSERRGSTAGVQGGIFVILSYVEEG